VDEIVRAAHRILRGLRVNEGAIARNMGTYGLFAATERLLMELVRQGADRQEMHEVIREHTLAAWDALRSMDAESGGRNPLPKLLTGDQRITAILSPDQVLALLEAGSYVGDAPRRARELAEGLAAEVTSKR
jgi:adenylosuccinate lyase